MAKTSWKSPVNGNWTTASRWTSGKVPGAADDATLGFGDGYTVTLSAAIKVRSITITDLGAVVEIAAPGKAVQTSGTLSNNGEIAIDITGSGGTAVTIGAALTNKGVLAIGNSAMIRATTVHAATLANTGSILLGGGANVAATLNIAHAAPSTLNGFFSLQGDALLQFAGGHVTTIGSSGELVLQGSHARVAVKGKTTSNSAITALSRNAGRLDLEDRAALTVSGKLTNTGRLELDGDASSTNGSRLKIAGILTNNDAIDIGTTGSDRILTSQMTVGGLVNNGTISIVGSAAPAILFVNKTTSEILTGTFDLLGWSVLEFAGGGVTTIAAGSKITLDGPRSLIALSNDPTSNSALEKLTSIQGSLELDNGVLDIGKTLTVGGATTSATLTLRESTISGGTLAQTGSSNIFLEGTCRLSDLTIAAGTQVNGVEGSLSNLPIDVIIDHIVVDGRLIASPSVAQLTFARPGVDALTNISGFTTIDLANGGANSIAVSRENFEFDGETINGGNAGNTINVSALSTFVITVNGGAKADKLIAGTGTTMTGAGGSDLFVFSAPPSSASPFAIDTVTDFAHLTDKLVFKDAGFDLGADEGKGTATPKPIDSSLFSSHADGSFATAANRFAYNKTTGQLFYDADGSGSAHASQLIASLSHTPTVSANDLFFVS